MKKCWKRGRSATKLVPFLTNVHIVHCPTFKILFDLVFLGQKERLNSKFCDSRPKIAKLPILGPRLRGKCTKKWQLWNPKKRKNMMSILVGPFAMECHWTWISWLLITNSPLALTCALGSTQMGRNGYILVLKNHLKIGKKSKKLLWIFKVFNDSNIYK